MVGFMKKIIRKIILKILLINGYTGFKAQLALEEIEEDLFKNNEVSLLKKIKLYKKGFISKFLKNYKLKDEKDLLIYLPKLKYYKIHPINGFYSKWIDDKLTIRYILDPFHDNLPKYYFQSINGEIIKLIDCPKIYSADISGFIHLLKDKGKIAAKLLYGTKRKGFYKISYIEDTFFINNKEVSEEDLKNMISSMENYLMTEYITPYEDMHKIYPTISSSVRIIVINDEEGFRITGSYISFGINKSGFVDDVETNGIVCGVNIKDGTLIDPIRYDENWDVTPILVHPDTGEEIKGRVKNWSSIVDLLIKIGEYLPQLCYLGYDIIVSKDSFKIIEINSLPDVNHMQIYYPGMKDDLNRRFFDSLISIVDKR